MTIEQLQREWPRVSLVENNICLLRDDWIGVGLFSERLKLYGFIGQEFFARARFLGMRYQFNPAATVTHHAEHEGDNGLQRSRKQRQTRLATLFRPSLMRPQHYRAQVAWAKAQAAGEQLVLPPFMWHAALALPLRATRMAVADARRLLRSALRPG
jgi:GT2 family glycosyltransferase